MWLLPLSQPVRRVVVALLACTLAATWAGPAHADTKTSISVQEKRLKWLEGVAAQKQANVARIQASMRKTGAKIREHNRALDVLERTYERHQNRLIDTMADYERLRGNMNATAGAAYMTGRVSYLGAVLNAETLTDSGDALFYTGLLLARDREVAARTFHAAKEIAKLRERDAELIDRRAAMLRDVRREQDLLVRSFAEAQEELERIADIREEVVSLLTSLKRRLHDEELARFGGTMPYGRWAETFLRSIHAPSPRGNMVALVAWQLAEGTSARWNPLATTWRMPGSTQFNGHRVQNYVSLEQGLEATRKTLSRPGRGYEKILESLAAGADAMTTARAINASSWCRGCADGEYVIELIGIVERYYDKYANRSRR